MLGGSGCGFSNGFADFNPAPAFNFWLRPAVLPFLAFIGDPPRESRSSSIHPQKRQCRFEGQRIYRP
jgi:hypothetical protein